MPAPQAIREYSTVEYLHCTGIAHDNGERAVTSPGGITTDKRYEHNDGTAKAGGKTQQTPERASSLRSSKRGSLLAATNLLAGEVHRSGRRWCCVAAARSGRPGDVPVRVAGDQRVGRDVVVNDRGAAPMRRFGRLGRFRRTPPSHSGATTPTPQTHRRPRVADGHPHRYRHRHDP